MLGSRKSVNDWLERNRNWFGGSSQAGHATREEVRAARSVPLFDKLMSELNTAALDENLLPGSALAKACDYALRLRAQLRRSLENGITEIDNNRCEQSIRPIALGRKIWLHIGAPGASPSVAAIISVVESCKRMGINVRTYLSEVLPRLAATLTPAKWLAARPPTVVPVTAGSPA